MRVGRIFRLMSLMAVTWNGARPIGFIKMKPVWPIAGGAVGYNYLGTTTSTTDTTSYTSNSFTPTANSVIVVFVVLPDCIQPTPTMTDTQSLGFQFVRRALYNASTWEIAWFIAVKKAAASSMTVTVDTGADAATGAGLFVYEVTGITRSGWAAVRQEASLSNNSAGGTTQAFFNYDAVSTNIVFGFVGNMSNPAGLTIPGFGGTYVEDADTGFATPTTGGEVVSRTAGTLNGMTWGTNSATLHAVIVCEIDASPQACIQSQANTNGGSGVSTFAVTFKTNVTAGSALAAVVYWNSNTVTATVSGSGAIGAFSSMAAVLRGAGGLASYSLQGFYKLNATAGAVTVTATWSAPVSDYGIVVMEISNAYTSWDAATASNYNGTTPGTSAFLPAHNNSFLVAVGLFAGAAGDPGTFTGGFTMEESRGFTSNQVNDKVLASASSQQATWGFTAAQDVLTLIGAFYQPTTAIPDWAGIAPIGF